MDVLWCQGAQNTGLSNHKLKSALKCTVWSQCTPVPDGQTDRQTNITVIARRFVQRTHRAPKLLITGTHVTWYIAMYAMHPFKWLYFANISPWLLTFDIECYCLQSTAVRRVCASPIRRAVDFYFLYWESMHADENQIILQFIFYTTVFLPCGM